MLQTGVITFYSLESQTIVGETKVSGEIVDLQICFDDSLDLLALLVGNKLSIYICSFVHNVYTNIFFFSIRYQEGSLSNGS